VVLQQCLADPGVMQLVRDSGACNCTSATCHKLQHLLRFACRPDGLLHLFADYKALQHTLSAAMLSNAELQAKVHDLELQKANLQQNITDLQQCQQGAAVGDIIESPSTKQLEQQPQPCQQQPATTSPTEDPVDGCAPLPAAAATSTAATAQAQAGNSEATQQQPAAAT